LNAAQSIVRVMPSFISRITTVRTPFSGGEFPTKRNFMYRYLH